MLVYPVLVLALGALWPLDWTPSRLNSLSPVTGQYHGTTWAMSEKVTGGNGTDEELLVVEGTTTDEVGKNKESTKGWMERYKKWIVFGVFLVLVIIAIVVAVTDGDDETHKWWYGVTPTVILLLVVMGVIIAQYWNNIIKAVSQIGCGGNSLKKMSAKNVD